MPDLLPSLSSTLIAALSPAALSTGTATGAPATTPDTIASAGAGVATLSFGQTLGQYLDTRDLSVDRPLLAAAPDPRQKPAATGKDLPAADADDMPLDAEATPPWLAAFVVPPIVPPTVQPTVVTQTPARPSSPDQPTTDALPVCAAAVPQPAPQPLAFSWQAQPSAALATPSESAAPASADFSATAAEPGDRPIVPTTQPLQNALSLSTPAPIAVAAPPAPVDPAQSLGSEPAIAMARASYLLPGRSMPLPAEKFNGRSDATSMPGPSQADPSPRAPQPVAAAQWAATPQPALPQATTPAALPAVTSGTIEGTASPAAVPPASPMPGGAIDKIALPSPDKTAAAQPATNQPATNQPAADPPILAAAAARPSAITVSTTPLPAGQAFAAAIATATSWHDRSMRNSTRDLADDATTIVTAAPIAVQERVVVHATADARGSALDLTKDTGLQRMIDRIETLRDDRDAGDTRIRLVPDALGSVDIAVRQEGDRVHVRFSAEQEATRALIADAQPRLTELAAARGVRIGETSVSGETTSGNITGGTMAGGSTMTGGSNNAAPQPRATPQPARAPRSAATETAFTDDQRLA